MAEAEASPWVVTSDRSSRGPFSSLSALWKTCGKAQITSPYERPPFPILVDKPSVYDVVGSWRASDYFMFGSIYGTGIVWSYFISRPFPSVMQRLLVYHSMSHLFFVAGAVSMAVIPYRRLTGYWDNGLRWSKPEDKLKKYDVTSHFEKATGWGRFRVKTD